jgi:uncharacterized protein YegL
MKKNLCELVCIIDKSGSMDSIKSDAIGGFNSFLKEQKKSTFDIKMTLALFDTDYKLVHEGKVITDVEELTEHSYFPGGGTALYDAIGRTMDNVGSRLHRTPENERPEKVLVVILTDGEENSSHVYSNEKINEMINHQRDKYNWEFIFLAANQDAFAVGNNIGINVNLSFCSTSRGIHKAFDGMKKLSTAYYSAGTESLSAVSSEVQKEILEGEDIDNF